MTIQELLLALETARSANMTALYACDLLIGQLRQQVESEGLIEPPAVAGGTPEEVKQCKCPPKHRRPAPTMGHLKRTYCTVCAKEHDA